MASEDPAIISCRLPSEHSSDVCLIIDVAQSFHPYLIGTKGQKCRDLMELSKCNIAFPNLNRIPKGPKLNNVQITGEIGSVEEVRKELRCRTPLHLVISNFKRSPEVILRAIEIFTKKHGLSLISHQIHKDSVHLKTDWSNDVAFGLFCHDVFNERSEMYSISVPCLSLINIRNKERNLNLLHFIKQRTGCHVYYPEMEFVANACPSLIVEGFDPYCVFLACRILFGLTMFQLSFDMPRDFHIDDADLKRFRRVHFVDVSIENKIGSRDLCSVVLRTFEFCSNKAYGIHAEIMGLDTGVRKSGYEFVEEVLVKLLSPDVLENSHLYFTKQPFDPESVYKKVSTPEQFFGHFYGSPGEVARPRSELSNMW